MEKFTIAEFMKLLNLDISEIGEGIVESGRIDLLKEACEAFPNGYLAPVLWHAVRHNNLEMVKYLLERGAEVCFCEDDKPTTLNRAILSNNPEIVKLLVERDIDVNSNKGYALVLASRWGNLEIVKLLVERGADIYYNGEDAIKWASKYGHNEVVKYLRGIGSSGQCCLRYDVR